MWGCELRRLPSLPEALLKDKGALLKGNLGHFHEAAGVS